jgi:hypothetical protein
MKVKVALKRVHSHFKKQGINILISAPRQHGDYKWSFQHNGYVGSFSVNSMHGWDEGALEGEATLFHVRRANDHSDSQSDYFAGSFRDNIKQVCESLLSSPPRYPTGSLVRGKTNKRASRLGFAGQVGLVVRAIDGYCEIRWVGVPEPRWKLTYSERDLELVS